MKFDHFDILAPFYDRFIQPGASDTLIEHLSATKNCRILDAGGGTGRVARTLVAAGHEVYIADLSLKMLQQADSLPGIKRVCTQTERLPFSAAQFDRVVVVDAWHHLNNQEYSASELWRALKPDGRLIIEEPDILNWKVKLIALAEKMFLMRSHFVPAKRIGGIFQEMGAKVQIHEDGITAWVIVDRPGQ